MSRARFVLVVLALAPVAARAQQAGTDVAELTERGAYAAALREARRAGLHVQAGHILRMTGRPADAARAYRQALQAGDADSLTARVQLAILQEESGEREAARRAFDRFIDLYNSGVARSAGDLVAVGTAVQHLSRYDPQLAHDALRAYDEAIALDPDHVEARLRVGALFLERYNGTEARAAYEEVLQRHPDHPRALLGLARTARFEGSRQSIQLVRRSLERNPNLVPARVFLAELLVELERYGDADAQIDSALAVHPDALDALAVRAAIGYLAGDDAGYRATVARARARHPASAALYTTLAEISARNRLYREAAEFARRAVAVDAFSWRGYALLGINQLRAGVMDSGRTNLEHAFRGDPFDVWTKNTLDLLDTLDRYPGTASERFRFYVDGKESALLTPYLAPLAEAAYDSLATRYGYRPATPIRVEVFPDHVDFSVRTVGLVGLGALGVSFGPVVAMDSPSARRRGEFNWGSTLWHEIAHSFHLGMTRHRVPRWLTEGLAVYEERRARTGWGDDVSPGFLAAYNAGRLLPVSRLNDGFTRPAYPEQIGFSYYQASLVCELIEEQWGLEALLNLLRGYREGASTAEVVARVLGEPIDAFDVRFDAWFRSRFAGPLAAITPPDTARVTRPTRAGIADRARRRPDDYLAQVAMAHLLLRDGRTDDAVAYLERARALLPEYAGHDSPHLPLARIYRARGDLDRARAELRAMTRIDERAYDAHLELAEVQLLLQDAEGAAATLDRIMYIFPYDPALHLQLADLAEQTGDLTRAIRERHAVLALDPVDRAEALYQLARVQLLAGQRDAARRNVVRALELAPGFDAAQELLLAIHEGTD